MLCASAIIAQGFANVKRVVASITTPAPIGWPRRRWLGWALAAGFALGGGACWGDPAQRESRPLGAPVADARDALRDPTTLAAWTAERLQALGTPTWLILGEQHDADSHQVLETATVRALATRGTLGALVLEMAEHGRDTTTLSANADEAAVQEALAWHEAGWPWARYGPVVMAAVRAGVPVYGGNLPRSEHRAVMADAAWDERLPPERLQALKQLIGTAHCGLLPPSQWGPMARIHIARDDRMAEALWTLRSAQRTVLLVTGVQHARRTQGVPVHLLRRHQAQPKGDLVVVELRASAAPRHAVDVPYPDADAVWLTPPTAPVDYCAALRRNR